MEFAFGKGPKYTFKREVEDSLLYGEQQGETGPRGRKIKGNFLLH